MIGDAQLVVIDGRAGSGKTTLADALLAELPQAQVVHMDDLTPGWRGLRRASAAAITLLRTGSTTSFDWVTNQPGPQIRLDSSRPLILEGCGALNRYTARLATVSAWLDDDPECRQERALRRDGELFAPHWETWQRQEMQHLRAERPDRFADIVMDGRRDTLSECSKLLFSFLDQAATSGQSSKPVPLDRSTLE